ncbi:MAG: DNA internalization-related competence protein ComEC/Rec2 [Clostridia bacterium]|nr:DNA internalization-related competence protein ComEC/Rec2 [Clostridia bacterium]
MREPVRDRHPWLLPLLTAALAVGILLGRAAPAWQGAAAGLALCLLYALLRHGRRRALGAALCVLFLGALLGYGAYHPAQPPEGGCTVTGVVAQELRLREDGQVQTILRDVRVDGRPWRSGAYWTWYLDEGETVPEQLLPGARVAFQGRAYHPSGAENPGGFDFREYLLQRGVDFGVYGADELTFPSGGFSLEGTLARLRHDLSGDLMRAMGEEAGAYAAAMLLGTRDFIAEEDNAAFQRLGIAHILSVSGYHVGVLSMMLALLLKPTRLGRRAQLMLRGGVLLAYCLLAGGQAPVIRAALLSVLWEMGRVRHRQTVQLHTLCFAAAIQLVFSPPLLLSASFQLTYGAMLGLLLLRPRISGLLHPEQPLLKWLWEALAASISAQLGILPAQLYWFGELPLLSLVLNLFITTLTTGVMALYWLTFACLQLPVVRETLGLAASGATRLLLAGVRGLDSMGISSLWLPRPDLLFILGWGMLCLGLMALVPRKLHRFRRPLMLGGAALMALILLPVPNQETTYIQFSAGEADAALLHDRDQVVVIDTGEDGQSLAGYLHQNRLGVDTLILTHLHTDHAGGLRAIIDQDIPVTRCFLPVDAQVPSIDPGLTEMVAELEARGTEICSLSRGDVLPLPSGRITCLWPEAGRTRPMQDANHASLVLLAEVRGTALLLTGDITGTYENYSAVPADLLKAAHHGSAGSTGADYLQTVSPQAILLSCGTEAREASLGARVGDIPVYSTNALGAVIVRFDEDAFRIYTHK